MRRWLWVALWLSLGLNVIYFVETDVWSKKLVKTLSERSSRVGRSILLMLQGSGGGGKR